MPLNTIVNSLQPAHRYALANVFIRRAMPLWDNYAATGKLSYVDSVVGITHQVSVDALNRAMHVINEEINNRGTQSTGLGKLKYEFKEYIVALQDGDFDVPDHVKLLFYAVDNFILEMTGQEFTAFNESMIYLVINQAIDALVSSGTMNYDEVNAIISVYQ